MSMDPRRELADPDSRFVDLLGTEVHYRCVGDGGPPVVLFHHFFGNVANWRHVIDLLSERARVVAFDRPAFGLTERPDDPDRYTRRYAAELTRALLDHLGWDQAVLVGASAGGTTALETYARYPDRVAGIGLVSPAITGDVGPPAFVRPFLRLPALRPIGQAIVRRAAGSLTVERIARAWADPSNAGPEDLAAYTRTTKVPGWERALWQLANAEGTPNLRHVLRDVEVPTVVVSGDQDRVISAHWNRRTAAAIPTATFELVEGCGHTPHEECPDALVAILGDLLDRVRAHPV